MEFGFQWEQSQPGVHIQLCKLAVGRKTGVLATCSTLIAKVLSRIMQPETRPCIASESHCYR